MRATNPGEVFQFAGILRLSTIGGNVRRRFVTRLVIRLEHCGRDVDIATGDVSRPFTGREAHRIYRFTASSKRALSQASRFARNGASVVGSIEITSLFGSVTFSV
jgi:hypothetical protein